jgi:hypothetical protein
MSENSSPGRRSQPPAGRDLLDHTTFVPNRVYQSRIACARATPLSVRTAAWPDLNRMMRACRRAVCRLGPSRGSPGESGPTPQLAASVSSDRRAQRIDEVSDRLAKVAVGNALAGVPPRRSVRAELPHTALVLGHGEDAAEPPPRTRCRLRDTSIRP